MVQATRNKQPETSLWDIFNNMRANDFGRPKRHFSPYLNSSLIFGIGRTDVWHFFDSVQKILIGQRLGLKTPMSFEIIRPCIHLASSKVK